MLKKLWLALACVAALGYAQVEPAAQVILDYVDAKALEALAGQPTNFETMTADMTTEFFELESITMVTMAIDADERRIASITNIEDGDFGMDMHIVYADGELRGVMSVNAELEPLPTDPVTAGALTTQFESMFDMLAEPSAPSYSCASYDGYRQYDGVLEGLQLTVETDIPLLDMPTMAALNPRTKLILSPDLLTIGTVVEVDGVTVLTVINDPVAYQRNPMMPDMTIYSYADGVATEVSRVQMTVTSLNEPLDPTLFELPEVPAN